MKPDQNNRQRSRPSNYRRPPNTQNQNRSYESNGPDIKIRGTAPHIAERYLQLARDAHTAGNAVATENYLQHAEHYIRLNAAAQAGPRATEQELDEDADDRRLPDRFALRQQPGASQPNFPAPVAVPTKADAWSSASTVPDDGGLAKAES
jgi:hypothetical protein